MLRAGTVLPIDGSVHLQLRVHVLPGLRIEQTRVRLPELWRRARPQTKSAAAERGHHLTLTVKLG